MDSNSTQNPTVQSFVSALVLNLVLFIVQVVLFAVLREVNKVIYTPKSILPEDPT